ncbi:MAG: universal stress protein [Desulfococcaceae bacterium]
MKKRILLSVDDSVHSRNAVRYAVEMTESIRELHFTLFQIQPRPSGYLVDEARTNFRAKNALEKFRGKRAAAANACLEEFRTEMEAMGIDPDRVECQTRPPKLDKARDILDYAQERQFDAIVMGRRGVGKVTEMIMGSVAKKVVEYSQVIPVWIVDGKVESRRILLAVDGSESARRAVDHVSFMLMNSPHVYVTLFHVTAWLGESCEMGPSEAEEDDPEKLIAQRDGRCFDSFIIGARKKFIEAGLSPKQIDVRQVKKTISVARSIVSEAEAGRYGTVVVGRKGVDRAFYTGSVSNFVLDRSSDRAVWLVS